MVLLLWLEIFVVAVVSLVVFDLCRKFSAWWKGRRISSPIPLPPSGSWLIFDHGTVGSFELLYSRHNGEIWFWRSRESTQEAALEALAAQLKHGLTKYEYSILYRVITQHYARYADAQCSGV